MSSWPYRQLGDVLELAYGKSLPKNSRAETGEIPVYGSNGITGWHNEPLLQGPAVIVGRKGSAGAVQFVDGPCFPIDTTYYVQPRSGFSFDYKFLYYLLVSLDLSRLKTATGVPGLTRDDAYKEQVPVPALAEQQHIVDILSRAEGIVRLQQQALDRAKALIPALFVELFGDPIDDVERVPLNDLAQVVSGVTKGRKFGGRETVFAPYLRVANVQDGHLNLSEIKEVEVLPSDIAALTLIPGDVLLTEGGDFDKLGRGAIWQGQINGCIHQNHVFRVRLNKEVCLPEFFAQFLQSTEARNYFLRCAKRTTNLASINMTQLRAMPIPAVSVALQKDFVTRLADAQSIITQQTAALTKSRELFDALLAQNFSTPSIE